MLNNDSFEATLQSIGVVDFVLANTDEGIRYGSGTSFRTAVAGGSGGDWDFRVLLVEELGSGSSEGGRLNWTVWTGFDGAGWPSPRGSSWKKSSPSDESVLAVDDEHESSTLLWVLFGSCTWFDRSMSPVCWVGWFGDTVLLGSIIC